MNAFRLKNPERVVRGLRAGVMAAAAGVLAVLMTGCANPGPPKPPSLHIPAAAKQMNAERTGDAVVITFEQPQRTTDGLLLTTPLHGTLCRQVAGEQCLVVASVPPVAALPAGSAKGSSVLTMTDRLPGTLTTGAARLLTYRLEFKNEHGESNGVSGTAWSVAGNTLDTVQGLRAQGSREGVVLRWNVSASGEVLIHRRALESTSGERTAVEQWLNAHAAGGDATLDDSAVVGVPYEYAAVVRQMYDVGGHRVEARSAASVPVRFRLEAVYPPAAPTGLTIAAYAVGEKRAADLIWQPVSDLHLAGYNVYRESGGRHVRLNAAPLGTSSFTDADAPATAVYSVTAVDDHGNESAADSAELAPQ